MRETQNKAKRKAKTINNGSFLKLFKTLSARVLSRLKIRRRSPRIFRLDKTRAVCSIAN